MSLVRLSELLTAAGLPVAYIEGSVSAPVVSYFQPITAQQQVTAAEIIAALPLTLATEAATAQAEATNEATLRQQAEQALTANKTRRDQIVAWRTTGPGRGQATSPRPNPPSPCARWPTIRRRSCSS